MVELFVQLLSNLSVVFTLSLSLWLIFYLIIVKSVCYIYIEFEFVVELFVQLLSNLSVVFTLSLSLWLNCLFNYCQI